MPKTVTASANINSVAVHTLNARGNVMLEVLRDHLGLSDRQMHALIRGYLARTVRLLSDKGIDYSALRSALVPQQDRQEIALIFNLTGRESWYSRAFADVLLPLLHKNSSRAFLHGDIFADTADGQRVLHAVLREVIVPSKPNSVLPGMQYAMYLNNLTGPMVERIHGGLLGVPAYAGYADTTYQSPLKSYLSSCLVNAFLQHRSVIIAQHEDDRPDSDDVNLIGFPFEEHGFAVRSIPGDPYGILLTYKIERPVLPGYEVDTEFSLNAVHPTPLSLDELEVVVEGAKFGYLANEKTGSLSRAGLLEGGAEKLKELIRAKIAANYIYSMSFNSEYAITKFNIIIEAETPQRGMFRLVCVLAYEPDKNSLRLITMF